MKVLTQKQLELSKILYIFFLQNKIEINLIELSRLLKTREGPLFRALKSLKEKGIIDFDEIKYNDHTYKIVIKNFNFIFLLYPYLNYNYNSNKNINVSEKSYNFDNR